MKETIEILDFLSNLNIKYEIAEHPPVFNCEEAARLVPPLPGKKSKNLVIETKDGSLFLIISAADKKLDLKRFAKITGLRNIHFAKHDTLKEKLSIAPGSVSILALFNDKPPGIKIIVEKEIWESGFIQAHPLRNTSTLSLAVDQVEIFLVETGHEYQIMELPYSE